MKTQFTLWLLTLLTLTLGACGSDKEKDSPIANDPRTIATDFADDANPHYEFVFNPDEAVCQVFLYNVQFSIGERLSPTLNIRIDVPYTLNAGMYNIQQNTEIIIPYMRRGETYVPADQFPVTDFKAVVNATGKTFSLTFNCHGGSYSDSGKTK